MLAPTELRDKLILNELGDSSEFNPLISIVIASFNSQKCIGKAIESVRKQTYRNIELIIIDGGSVDDTVEEIKKNSDIIKVWISERDSGIYDAWNKGLNFGGGNYFSFLGSDDEFYEDAMERYVRFIRQHRDVEYISSQVDLIDDDRFVRTIGENWSWPKFRRYMNVAHVGSLHHRSLFEKYGQFDVNFKVAGDYELLLRGRGELKAGFLPTPTCRMGLGGISNRNYRVFHESRDAKIKNKAVGACAATKDMLIAMLKYEIRSRLGI